MNKPNNELEKTAGLIIAFLLAMTGACMPLLYVALVSIIEDMTTVPCEIPVSIACGLLAAVFVGASLFVINDVNE